MKIIGEPGHYVPGAKSNHFLGLCDECDAHYMLNMTLEQVENWYNQGVFGQAKYEGYMWVWSNGPRLTSRWDGWRKDPQPDAREFGEMLKRLSERAIRPGMGGPA